MDRTQDCGSCNRGSTPREGTTQKHRNAVFLIALAASQLLGLREEANNGAMRIQQNAPRVGAQPEEARRRDERRGRLQLAKRASRGHNTKTPQRGVFDCPRSKPFSLNVLHFWNSLVQLLGK